MSPQQLLESWLADQKLITPEKADPYRQLWDSWLRWLAQVDPGINYLNATPAHVAQFLKTGRSVMSPANYAPVNRRDDPREGAPKKRRFGPKTGQFSPTTQRRYWRTLERIYGWALEKGQIRGQNPLAAADRQQRPASQQTEGSVITDRVWDAIEEWLPKTDHWLDVRDRAIVRLIMDLALTPGEVCALRHDQVIWNAPVRGRLAVRLTPLGRQAQQRDLLASKGTSDALRAWRAQRQALSVRPAAKDLLFLSLRRTPLQRKQLFILISRVINVAHWQVMGETPPKHSPMVLRNTRLVRRLRAGEDPATVAKEAGFRDTRSFRGLLPRLRELPAR
jgi:integrase/recombinase XerC